MKSSRLQRLFAEASKASKRVSTYGLNKKDNLEREAMKVVNGKRKS